MTTYCKKCHQYKYGFPITVLRRQVKKSNNSQQYNSDFLFDIVVGEPMKNPTKFHKEFSNASPYK